MGTKKIVEEELNGSEKITSDGVGHRGRKRMRLG